jgi:hypothetical protein
MQKSRPDGEIFTRKTFTIKPNMMRNLRIAGIAILLAMLVHHRAWAAGSSLSETIDRELKAAWVNEKITPPERSTDPVFLRRVYLDIVGVAPSYAETVAFLKDTDPKKRGKLVDNLLADPRYSQNQAVVWDTVLFGRENAKFGGYRGREEFRKWMAAQFQNNVPYDRIVNKLLTAEENGSERFYMQYDGAEETATAVSRMFMGTQLQCARCHDHPFERWTQRDFYGMAGFFARLMIVPDGSAPKEKPKFFIGEKNSGDVLFTVSAKPGKKSKGDPIKPKFLGGDELQEPEVPKDYVEPKLKDKEKPPKPTFSRIEKVVGWITAKENPYFARAIANRIWAQYMGRGFVHPVDDLTEKNQPSHPALFKAIEEALIANKFDLRWLVREIVNSEAYQAADIGPTPDALPRNYERARVRPLTAEELFTSLYVATGNGADTGLKMVTANGDVMTYFGVPADGQGTFQGSLSEHLFAHNGEAFRSACSPKKDNLADSLLKSEEGREAKIERMFLSILNRMPTAEDREQFGKYLDVDAKDTKVATQRISEAIWVLVSSSEFRFNK